MQKISLLQCKEADLDATRIENSRCGGKSVAFMRVLLASKLRGRLYSRVHLKFHQRVVRR